jgi:cytochrome c-type biogenesis protein CcmH/NrfG
LSCEAFRLPGLAALVWVAAAWWSDRLPPPRAWALPVPFARVLGAVLALASGYAAFTSARTSVAEIFTRPTGTYLEHLPADLPARALELEGLLKGKAGSADEWAHRHELGNVYSKMGRLKDAEGAFREAVRLNPRSSSSLINLGNVFVLEAEEDARMLGSAVDCYRRALDLEPDALEARFNLAYAYYLQKRMPEALRELDGVLDRQADHGKALQLKRIIVP